MMIKCFENNYVIKKNNHFSIWITIIILTEIAPSVSEMVMTKTCNGN